MARTLILLYCVTLATCPLLELQAGERRGPAPLVVSCSGDGDYTSIQEAIDAADHETVIVVRPNDCTPDKRYYETINFGGKSVLLRSVDPDDPQVVKATVIDGSMHGGSVVSFVSGESRRAVLDGLTITGGTGTDATHPAYGIPWLSYIGGGILCIDSHPTIRRCNVIRNRATTGGGIAAFGGAPLIVDSRIGMNRTTHRESQIGAVLPEGGGIALFNCPAHVLRCVIDRNIADPTGNFLEMSTGAGVMIGASTLLPASKGRPVLENCRLVNNRALGSKSGPGQPTSGGGALYAADLGNVQYPLDLLVLNSLIVDNTSFDAGGAIILAGQNPQSRAEIRGCTLVGNVDLIGCVTSFSTTVEVTNTIFHGNDTPLDFREPGPSLGSLRYCKLDTLVPGMGNIDQAIN